MPTKLSWKEGTPDASGGAGFFWVVDDEGEKAVIEVDIDGGWRKPKHLGKVVAYCGPIEEPDDETLP